MPTVYVGSTVEECRATCEGCPLLRDKVCYAQYGTPFMGFMSMVRSKFKRNPTNPAEALDQAHPYARGCRLGALGDPSALGVRMLAWIRREATARGLRIVGYTHHWRKLRSPTYRRNLMASCDDLSQLAEAEAAGWRPAGIIPYNTTDEDLARLAAVGARLCPAQAAERKGRTKTCNQCLLCDPTNPAWGKSLRAILFLEHGPRARKAAN